MYEFIDQILTPIKWVVAWIMVLFHQGLSAIGLPEASGVTWALSIVGLTVVIRLVLVPLFVKQIKASRGMQLMQPDLLKLQAKYKGKTDQLSRQAMAQEQMALYKKHGTNPFSACMPILIQMPIFFSLFRVLNELHDVSVGKREPIGGLTQALAAQAENSTIFGAPFSATFMHPGTGGVWVQILAAVMIVLMSASQFVTQKQIMAKNMSEAAMNNPFMKQQKMMLYLFPVIFAVGGINFPIGVLIYWLVSNLWTMGQQFYVIQRMPAPGSPAEKAYEERKARKAARRGLLGFGKAETVATGEVVEGSAGDGASGDAADSGGKAAESRQRKQPVRKDRRKKQGGQGRRK